MEKNEILFIHSSNYGIIYSGIKSECNKFMKRTSMLGEVVLLNKSEFDEIEKAKKLFHNPKKNK